MANDTIPYEVTLTLNQSDFELLQLLYALVLDPDMEVDETTFEHLSARLLDLIVRYNTAVNRSLILKGESHEAQ